MRHVVFFCFGVSAKLTVAYVWMFLNFVIL